MRITKADNNKYNGTSFGIKLPTRSVLEVTTGRILSDDGVNGVKEVVLGLNPALTNRIGSRGYMGHARIFAEKILSKYPELREPTKQLNSIKDKGEARVAVNNIVNLLGKEIDINI